MLMTMKMMILILMMITMTAELNQLISQPKMMKMMIPELSQSWHTEIQYAMSQWNPTTAQDNISADELKARLYRFDGDIKVFELNLDADQRLSKNDILKYAEELEIPYFRGVFERDGLPKSSNQIECAMVNFENHWVCKHSLLL